MLSLVSDERQACSVLIPVRGDQVTGVRRRLTWQGVARGCTAADLATAATPTPVDMDPIPVRGDQVTGARRRPTWPGVAPRPTAGNMVNDTAGNDILSSKGRLNPDRYIAKKGRTHRTLCHRAVLEAWSYTVNTESELLKAASPVTATVCKPHFFPNGICLS
eukprot:scpid85288/ scgid29138/ 